MSGDEYLVERIKQLEEENKNLANLNAQLQSTNGMFARVINSVLDDLEVVKDCITYKGTVILEKEENPAEYDIVVKTKSKMAEIEEEK